MEKKKSARLAAGGWTIGDAGDFLGLTPDESAYVEMKLSLCDELKIRRTRLGMSQLALARRLGSSQSRVAKMEAGDPTVSIDLLMRGLLAAGATRADIATAIARGSRENTTRAAGSTRS